MLQETLFLLTHNIYTSGLEENQYNGIGVLTKIRHYANIHILTQLYYTLFFFS